MNCGTKVAALIVKELEEFDSGEFDNRIVGENAVEDNTTEDEDDEGVEEVSQHESEFEIEVQEVDEEITTKGVQEQVKNWSHIDEIPAFVPKPNSNPSSKRIVVPLSSSKIFNFFPPVEGSTVTSSPSTSLVSISQQHQYPDYPDMRPPIPEIRYNQPQPQPFNWIPITNNNQPQFDRMSPTQHQIMLQNYQILMEQQVIGQQFRSFAHQPTGQFQVHNQNQYQQTSFGTNQSQPLMNQDYRPSHSQYQSSFQKSPHYPPQNTSNLWNSSWISMMKAIVVMEVVKM